MNQPSTETQVNQHPHSGMAINTKKMGAIRKPTDRVGGSSEPPNELLAPHQERYRTPLLKIPRDIHPLSRFIRLQNGVGNRLGTGTIVKARHGVTPFDDR